MYRKLHPAEPDAILFKRRVAWKDLVPLSLGERVWELTVSIPWLAGSLLFYCWSDQHPVWLFAGMFCSFYFFLTGLRTSHNAQHGNIGIGRRGHDLVLLALSGLMLTSMHAIRTTHLHHHRHCLDEQDVEASTARLVWWRAIAAGPWFIVTLHRTAWQLGHPTTRRWIAAELMMVLTVVVGAAVLPWFFPGLERPAVARAGNGGGGVPHRVFRGVDGASWLR